MGPPWPQWAPFYGDVETCRELYVRHRGKLLTCGNWGPLGCGPFWEFEAGAPDGRDDSEPDLEYVDGGVAALDRLTRRRLAWLVAQRALFESLPDGLKLYSELRARHLE